MLFLFDRNSPTHGIIYYLYQNKYEIYQNELLAESSTAAILGEPRNTIDFNDDQYWIAVSQANITYTMPYNIKLTGYTIQTSDYPAYNSHPKEWYFYASKNGKDYFFIDHFLDQNESMNTNLAWKHIDVETKSSYRFFRIETAQSYASVHPKQFDFNQFEVFGELISYPLSKPFIFSYHYLFFTEPVLYALYLY